MIEIKGVIGPATDSYIARAIKVSAQREDACLIIQLDTPGGLLESTKRITQSFYASPVPIVVYVTPSGASATSARTIPCADTRPSEPPASASRSVSTIHTRARSPAVAPSASRIA